MYERHGGGREGGGRSDIMQKIVALLNTYISFNSCLLLCHFWGNKSSTYPEYNLSALIGDIVFGLHLCPLLVLVGFGRNFTYGLAI
jgi:hypothetical protein